MSLCSNHDNKTLSTFPTPAFEYNYDSVAYNNIRDYNAIKHKSCEIYIITLGIMV